MQNREQADRTIANDPEINEAIGVQKAGRWSQVAGLLATSGSSIWAYQNGGESISVTPLQGDALVASVAVLAMGLLIKEIGHGMEGKALGRLVEKEKAGLLEKPA